MEARIKMFDPVIYPRYLWVATGDEKEVLSRFRYIDGKPVTDSEDGNFSASTFYNIMDENSSLGVLVWIKPSAAKPQIMVHEATHAAIDIFTDLGIRFECGNSDHYAYFVEWVFKCIMDFFVELNDKHQLE